MKQITCVSCGLSKLVKRAYSGPKCKACYMRFWRIANPEANRRIEARRKKSPAVRAAEWRKKNPEKHKILKKLNYEKNKEKFFVRNQKRRAVAKKATPPWITREQLNEMALLYKNRPAGYHVDHIVPLNGLSVCGLNVPWNLQYLPANENLKKGNRLK